MPALPNPLLARVARYEDAEEENYGEKDDEEDGEGYDVGFGEIFSFRQGVEVEVVVVRSGGGGEEKEVSGSLEPWDECNWWHFE